MRRRLASAIVAAGASQAFWYLSLPIVARLYGQEGMGLYGQFLTYSAVISLIVGARADLAILTSPHRRLAVTRSAFFKLSVLLTLCLFACLAAFAGMSGGGNVTAPFVASVVVSGLLMSRFMVDGAALIKLERSKELLSSAFFRSVVQGLVQCGIFAIGQYGLVIGKVTGDVVGVSARVYALGKNGFPRFALPSLGFTRKELWALRKNANAYKYSFPQTLLNSISQGLPLILLPSVVAIGWIGQYTLAFTVVVAPLGLVATPLRQVLISKCSESVARNSSQSAERAVVSWMLGMAGLALAGALSLHFLARPIISLVFGSEWSQAAELVSILWWWAGSGLVMTPALALLLARGRNRDHLISEVVILLGRLGALALGALVFSGNGVVVPFVVWSACANVLGGIWMYRRAQCPGP